MKQLQVLVLMDPLSSIHPEQDTTFALALAGQEAGHQMHYAQVGDLQLRGATPFVHCRQIWFQRDACCYRWDSPGQECSLEEFDLVLLRKDPPFDEDYFFATHFLELARRPLILNHPRALRDAPEKLFPLRFPQVIPPTLISRKAGEIKAFLQEQGAIILKPLNRCGGAGVIYLEAGDRNFNSLIELSTGDFTRHIVAQRYLPEIRQGDKRVIVLQGQAVGGLLRTPQPEEHRGNIHVGGQVSLSPLTPREQWLVEQVGPALVAMGLYFVGLDIIGGYITEINVTSPTGIQEIHRLGGIDIAPLFWQRLPWKAAP